jgi:dihydrofolate reductase
MGKVFSDMAVSVDGFITGRGAGPGRGLGDAAVLHEWYWNGDVPSEVLDGFRLTEPSRQVVDQIARRVGAVVAGRNSYDDAEGWGGGGPHPTAPLVVVSHRPAPPDATDRQTFVTSIEDGVAAARSVAGDADVHLMGGQVVTAALRAGLVDELLLHQIPVLLGAGRRFFAELPAHLNLAVAEVVSAPDVTHLRYTVEK